MMGHRQVEQAASFYEFSLEKHIPADHLLRSIDRFVDLEQVRQDLAPFYSSIGRPSIDPRIISNQSNLPVYALTEPAVRPAT
jgi:transposase